jgi:hypothetical protein
MTKSEKMEELYQILNSFPKERLAFLLQVDLKRGGRVYPDGEKIVKQMAKRVDKDVLVTHVWRKWSQYIK